jgi:hypothetical protein
MFRKLNKPQLTTIKQQNFIAIRAFDSRLYIDISKWRDEVHVVMLDECFMHDPLQRC